MTQIIKHFPELDFTVVAVPLEYKVKYKIYEIIGIVGENTYLYSTEQHMLDTESVEEAQVYIHGEVKWDGCSNWYFDEQDRVMLHGCSKQDILRYGLILAECWDWTKELCINWDKDNEH